MSESLGSRVARNAASAFGGQVGIAIMGLVITAILVRAVGPARFGGWSLITAVIAYASLMDLGMGVALVRQVAEAERRGDRRGAGEAVGAALLFTLTAALATAVLIWLLSAPAAGWFNIPAEARAEFVRALRISGFGAALAVPAAALGAVPQAFQQLARVVRLEVWVTLAVMITQAAALLAGGGLEWVAWAFVAGRLLSLAGRWRMARALLDGAALRAGWAYPFWDTLGRFGMLKLAHQLMSQVVLYLDRLLVGIFVSVEAVAFYAVAMEAAQRLLMIQSNVSQAFFPAAASLAGNRDAFADLYRRSTRVVALATFPAAFILAVLAGPLIHVWVGPAFAPAADVLRIVALAYAVMSLTAIPAAAADALNHPGLSVRYGMLSVAINLALALALIPRYGAVGAAVAVAGSIALGTPPFLLAVGRLVRAQ